MLEKIIIFVCGFCGATMSSDVIANEQGNECPICHGKSNIYRNDKIKKAFDDINNIIDRGFVVEAVFVDNNTVSNPRLVVRLTDDYFNDWNSLKMPDGFEVKRTRNEGICPIEMIYYFDVGHAITKDKFHLALDKVLDNLAEWANNFPVLK